MAPRQFTDSNGNPLVGGSVGYYVPGTGGGTLATVYGDEAQTIVLTNPVPLDSAGRTFSGGSQIPVWADGVYEEIVRDRYGQIVSTNDVETPFSSAGGTIHGDLEVAGNTTLDQDLQVDGNTNVDGTFTAGSADITGNLTVGGIATIGGNESVGGNQTIGGDMTVAGTATIAGASTTAGITDSVGITTTGTVTCNALVTNQITLDGDVLDIPQKIQGGLVTLDTNGNANVAYPVILNNLLSIVVSAVSPTPTLSITSFNNSGFGVSTGVPPTTTNQFFWIAIGN
jgi:cytoskeletal protein CcmA (bactofilin family)